MLEELCSLTVKYINPVNVLFNIHYSHILYYFPNDATILKPKHNSFEIKESTEGIVFISANTEVNVVQHDCNSAFPLFFL